MIFTIGLVTAIIGWLFQRLSPTYWQMVPGNIEMFGTGVLTLGWLEMGVSILLWTWKNLP